jgi:hypothetical protein
MRQPEPDPALCGGIGEGRSLPRPSRSSSSRNPASSFSAIGRDRKSYSSREDSDRKRDASALIARGWRYVGFKNSERKEMWSEVKGVSGVGGASSESG